MFTAKDVEIAEKLVARITSQGSGSFSRSHNEPPTRAGQRSADEIARMTPAQRLDYTRERSQQSKMPEWQDPRAA